MGLGRDPAEPQKIEINGDAECSAQNWQAIESTAMIYPGFSQESKGIRGDIKNTVQEIKW